MANLFSNFTIKSYNIKNRVVLPPIVNFGWADKNGFVSEKHIKHYENIAKGGVGIIIVEATCVLKDGKIFSYQPGIWNNMHMEGLKKITDACHRHGALILLQIQHSGLRTYKGVSDIAVGPSIDPENERSAALTIEGIKVIEAAFIEAATRALLAGFDGIELHGAHGYLLNQFANSAINKRTDEYGNSLSGRLKLATDIIKGIKQSCHANFIIGYRMGANSPTLLDGIEIGKHLEKNGIDILHVSHGGDKGITPEIPANFPNNWIVYCGTEVKKHVKIPIIVVNEIRTPERASWLLENGMTDFVAIGRDLLTDNLWLQKAQTNKKINYCIHCLPLCKRYAKPESCPVTK
ncbi:MAG: NADH:flavin oxidoreductase [Bacteroidales bacterium]|nr:NADH:flavin oxidoreductase [Bacteroidales bacterium]